MLVSNSLLALFKSSFAFYVVDLHSRPSSIIVFLAKGLPSLLTIMADLPDCRLPSANHFPFLTTGLDFVGPFPIKENGQFEGRYCLLFTCLVTRAVHIETCADLNTETTLMAIRRFVSLRGNPQQIYSDNATTFIKASKELKDGNEKPRTDNSFRDALLLLHLDWRFIPHHRLILVVLERVW